MKLTLIIITACALFCSFTVADKLSNHNGEAKDSRPLITRDGEDPDPEVNEKREFIKRMMKDAWTDYERWAWGQNELKPISQTGQTGGIYGNSKIGATIIDSLDTLLIMGFNDEYANGRKWVAENFDFGAVNTTVSLFETNIRILGGFLTAYALTNDSLYVDLAYDVGKKLLPAFDTPTGIPHGEINPATGVAIGEAISMAALGTLHLEFVYLSEVTKDPIFALKVLKIQQHVNAMEKWNGLYLNQINVTTGNFSRNIVSMGGGSDSFYEYLLKAWIQTGDQTARNMYDEAVNAFVQNDLVRTSPQSHLLYIAEINNGQYVDLGSHLQCFAGGMFALGSATDPRHPADGQRDRDMEIGQNFTNTCHESYIRSATRIGPEVFRFSDTVEAEGVSDGDKPYILRPEVIESYFILYRLTKDSKYRDWGWDAATAIEKYCKAGPERGYSGIRNVYSSTSPNQDDVQQTFFLAETLKYLYLLFSTDDLIDLDNWVFNTESHPLPIKGRNPMF